MGLDDKPHRSHADPGVDDDGRREDLGQAVVGPAGRHDIQVAVCEEELVVAHLDDALTHGQDAVR